jgi:chorismate mutase/prephenate dehydratase
VSHVNSESLDAELAEVRKAIDTLDAQLVSLLNQRAEYSLRVKDIKEKAHLTTYVPAREREVIERAVRLAEGGLFPKECLRRIFQNIFSSSRALQGEQIIAYLGPRTSRSFDAAVRRFGRDVILQPETIINNVFERVANRSASYGVVPLETCGGGLSSMVLEAFLDHKVVMVSEVLGKTELLLLAPPGAVGGISRVFTDACSAAMAEKWLTVNLPDAQIEIVSSVDSAAKKILAIPGAVAVGSEYLSETYNLSVLAKGIEDEGGVNRYVVIGTAGCPLSGRDKTSLLCSVHDRPGALLEILQPFARSNITLTKIESRVLSPNVGELQKADLYFFVDFLGHVDEQVVQSALGELRQFCGSCHILGSYPVDIG